MHGVHVRQMVGGRMEIELWAVDAWHSQGAEWVRGRNVKAWYFPKNRKPATSAITELASQMTASARAASSGSGSGRSGLAVPRRHHSRMVRQVPVRPKA